MGIRDLRNRALNVVGISTGRTDIPSEDVGSRAAMTEPATGDVTTIASLNDVALSSPLVGDVLSYSGSHWQNGAVPLLYDSNGHVLLSRLSGVTAAQLDPAAGVTGAQIAGAAGILASQMSSGAAPSGQAFTANGTGGTALANPTAAAHASTHSTPGGSDDTLAHMGWMSANRLETFPRTSIATNIAPTSQTCYFTMFTAPYSVAATKLLFQTGGTAGSGISAARLALYVYNGSSTWACVAATANFTAAASFALIPQSIALAGDFSTALGSYTLARGTRFAIGLYFNASGPPTVGSLSNNIQKGTFQLKPYGCFLLPATQADLPSGSTAFTDTTITTTANFSSVCFWLAASTSALG